MKKAPPAPTVSAALKADLKINLKLEGKYDNQPLFVENSRRANEILAKAGAPKV